MTSPTKEAVEAARRNLIERGVDGWTLALARQFLPEATAQDRAKLQVAVLDLAAECSAALAAPVRSHEAPPASVIDQLQEIADGAWGDDPATRGRARDELKRLAALTPPAPEPDGLRKWREDQLERVKDGSFLKAPAAVPVTDEMILVAMDAFDDGVGDPNDYRRRMGKALKAAFAISTALASFPAGKAEALVSTDQHAVENEASAAAPPKTLRSQSHDAS